MSKKILEFLDFWKLIMQKFKIFGFVNPTPTQRDILFQSNFWAKLTFLLTLTKFCANDSSTFKKKFINFYFNIIWVKSFLSKQYFASNYINLS